MAFHTAKPSRLQQTAALQIDRLLKRATYSTLTGDFSSAKQHHLEAVAWKALMGRYSVPQTRRAG